MLKEKVSLADSYTVLNRTILNENDRKLLIMLYQPIIGSIATSLYFVLWSYLDKNEVMSLEWTHHHLVSSMRLKLEEIIIAREKLEAIGLLKSYVKKGSSNHFVYELYSPHGAHEFFANPILGMTLYHNVGQTEFEKIKEYFRIPKVSLKGYEDITCHFAEVFEASDFTNYESIVDDVKKSRVGSLEIASNLNLDHVFSLIPDELLSLKNVTLKTKNLLYNLSFIYNYDDEIMSQMIMSSIVDKKIDHTKLKEKCSKCYQFEHSGNLPTLAYRNQPECLRKKTTENNKRAKLIYQFETTSPYEFLSSKHNGETITKQETEILSYLLLDLKLKPGVVNVILDYILKESDNKLIKSYVEMVASQFARSKIETVEEAMKLAEKEHKNKHKKKNITNESKPTWLDKKIQEKEASQSEVEKMEALLKKYE